MTWHGSATQYYVCTVHKWWVYQPSLPGNPGLVSFLLLRWKKQYVGPKNLLSQAAPSPGRMGGVAKGWREGPVLQNRQAHDRNPQIGTKQRISKGTEMSDTVRPRDRKFCCLVWGKGGTGFVQRYAQMVIQNGEPTLLVCICTGTLATRRVGSEIGTDPSVWACTGKLSDVTAFPAGTGMGWIWPMEAVHSCLHRAYHP